MGETGEPRQRPADGGFTLIELLSVVTIIGILAAIAVTAYSGQQEKAYLSTVRIDLHNLAEAQRTYFADHSAYATAHQLADDVDYRTSADGVASVVWSSSRVGAQSTSPCPAPGGAAGMDGGYWDDAGAH